ncbi:LamG domain-containing protein [Nocardioides sp. URHA0020]|uniref:LamG domain-containing protein n=1 Tax=Nocardioides sp. URHA0020 TaxID=1380392 RepID=UPI000684A38D|nr:LamG domain-containing protein [Nocardioides sp. URHA0020]
MSRWTLYPGPSRLPDAAAPDVRARSHSIAADVLLAPGQGGVLIAHGDRTSGYAVRIADGHLVHHYVHGGGLSSTVSTSRVPVGRPVRVEVRVRRAGPGGTVTLSVDGVEVGAGTIPSLARARTGYTGVDVGCDRGLTVGEYAAPARFTGRFSRIDIEAADDQLLDQAATWAITDATA